MLRQIQKRIKIEKHTTMNDDELKTDGDLQQELLKAKAEIKFLKELRELEGIRYRLISHDLKNPFMVILGFLEIMTDSRFNFSDISNVKDNISLISDSAKTFFSFLTETLPNTIDFSKMKQFNPQKINLSNLVSDISVAQIMVAKKKNVNLSSLIDKDIEVYSDIFMLTSILNNLVSNSIKFSNENGAVVLDATVSDDIISISVKDCGIGMSGDICSKIFDPEFTISREGTNGEKGTGFGLVATKFLIEKCGGSIDIESIKGKGTTVIFTIPCHLESN